MQKCADSYYKEFEKEKIVWGNIAYEASFGFDMEIGSDKEFLDFGGWVQEVDYEGMPELITIHRFAFNGLSSEQKIKQALYHVNKLSEGDVVYSFWDSELYGYIVSTITEGVNNHAVKSDLAIYTCGFVNSQERVFILFTKNY